MGYITSAESRRSLDEYMERVVKNRNELVITRSDRPSVVMLPLADYESLKETLHLLGSRANAEHLLRSVAELESGRGTERRPIEE